MKPCNLGEIISEDPTRPRSAPKRMYAINFEIKNDNTPDFWLIFSCWAKELAKSPPWTAKQEIPPVVNPVIKASQIWFMGYIVSNESVNFNGSIILCNS